MARGGGNKKRFQHCADSSGEILCFRALQGHSGRNLIDPSSQDNVLIPNDLFHYIYHIGYAINLLPSINSGLIPGGQISSKRQTVFFLLVDPMDKEPQDPETIDLGTASCSTCIKHGRDIRTQCIGSISNLLKRKDWSSIRINRMPSSFTIYSQVIVSRELFGWKLEKSCTKKYMNHLDCPRRFPWDMIGWRNWVQKLLDKQKSTNQPNQTLIQIMNKRPVWVLRKSVHVSFVTARRPICLLNVYRKIKTQTKT